MIESLFSVIRIFLTSLSLALVPSIALAQYPVLDLEANVIAELVQLRKISEPNLVYDIVVDSDGTTETRLIELDLQPLGRIRMKTRGPVAAGRYPVVFLATGLQTGMESIRLIDSDYPVILAAFDYPIDANNPPEKIVEEVVGGLLTLQAKMAIALNWLSHRANVREDRVSLLTVSFGTFATPLALRLAQLLGFRAHSTVFAFGGAEVMPLIQNELAIGGTFLSPEDGRRLYAAVGAAADFIEPKRHLKYLQSRFLVVQGLRDEVIPAASTQALMRELPQPKSLETLDCQHINTDRRDIIDATAGLVLRWLKSNGALD